MIEIENREYHIDDPALPPLFLQSWQHKEKETRGTLLITHGISEHSECYEALAHELAAKGWTVYAWDLRGHGKSPGKRGYVREFSDYAQDLKLLVKKIRENSDQPNRKFHLIGHSMGGLITLQALMSGDAPDVKSAILSNPCLKIGIPVPKIKKVASQWLNQVWPTLTLGNEVRYELLSRDPKMIESYGKDPLRHTKISPPLFLGMVEAMEQVNNHPDHLKTPVFFQLSGQDRLVDPQASLQFFERLSGPKELKVYEESFHEVYNDLDRQESIDDLLNYLGE